MKVQWQKMIQVAYRKMKINFHPHHRDGDDIIKELKYWQIFTVEVHSALENKAKKIVFL